jgi:hypothetical protein
MNRVISMAPEKMDIEIALRSDMGCPVLNRETTVHFMNPTSGQARTIYEWMRRTKMRQYILISNCDNVIDQGSILDGFGLLAKNACRGIVYTFRPKDAHDDRWSYVKTKGDFITKIEEKVVLSTQAVAGVYLLNMFALRMALFDTDVYLSSALDRMDGLLAMPARGYAGWNTMEQLRELETGVKQVH